MPCFSRCVLNAVGRAILCEIEGAINNEPENAWDEDSILGRAAGAEKLPATVHLLLVARARGSVGEKRAALRVLALERLLAIAAIE